jgi:hypothetical protein
MRRTRTSVTILIVAGLMFAGAVAVSIREAESSSGDEVGRYQLAAGYYDGMVREGFEPGPRGLAQRAGVFKIDTATGRTWVYKEIMDNRSIIEPSFSREWIPID